MLRKDRSRNNQQTSHTPHCPASQPTFPLCPALRWRTPVSKCSSVVTGELRQLLWDSPGSRLETKAEHRGIGFYTIFIFPSDIERTGPPNGITGLSWWKVRAAPVPSVHPSPSPPLAMLPALCMCLYTRSWSPCMKREHKTMLGLGAVEQRKHKNQTWGPCSEHSYS